MADVDLPGKTLRLYAALPADLGQAAELLRAGGLVAFPTETVYGLGANAFDLRAVECIFAAKQRPSWDPVIVHIADRAMLPEIVAESGDLAKALMATFWPGPLTLLLPRTPRIPDAVTAGRPLVGVRMPTHPVALALIAQAGVPVAAPSANTFGHTSPTTAAHVLADLDGRIDAVLDGGAATVGLESTVAGLEPEGLVVYRPGTVSVTMLEAVAGVGRVRLHLARRRAEESVTAMPSPGVGLRHYAPRAALILVPAPERTWERQIAEALTKTMKLGLMLPEGWLTDDAAVIFPWGPWGDPDTLARRLYEGLRALDDAGVEIILCPVPPGEGVARAIRDRLEKAGQPRRVPFPPPPLVQPQGNHR